MHNYLMILSLSSTALMLGTYTTLGLIYLKEDFKEPTWTNIRNGAFLGWLLIQCLLHYAGSMREITLEDYLAPIFTLATTGFYAYAITRKATPPGLGIAVWLLLALSLGLQTYFARTLHYLTVNESYYVIDFMMGSVSLTFAIHEIRTNAKRKAWLAQFDNPKVGAR